MVVVDTDTYWFATLHFWGRWWVTRLNRRRLTALLIEDVKPEP